MYNLTFILFFKSLLFYFVLLEFQYKINIESYADKEKKGIVLKNIIRMDNCFNNKTERELI